MNRYLWLAAGLSLTGCVAVGPRYQEPDPSDLQSGYIYGDRDVFVNAALHNDRHWWEAYSDERIAQAVRIALENNRDLTAAAARLEAAEARAGAARRALLPQGGTSFAITRQQQARAAFAGIFGPDTSEGEGPDSPVPDQGATTPEFTTYQAAAQASWEVDLFGRLRRQAQSARAAAGEQEALLADTQRLVSARTVDTFLLLVEALNRRDVAKRNLAAQERTLVLTEQLFELGEVPKLNLLQQETLVRSTAAQVKQVEAGAAQATAALALLLGLTVPEMLATFPGLVAEEGAPPIPTAEEVLVLTEPAAVLRRRPDVAAAERRLAAETYDIGIATAGLFPSITLDGTASLIALDFADLTDEQAFGYQAGPTISWQILSYPRLLRERAAQRAEAAAALAAYENAVLSALTETDEALALYTGAVAQARLLADAERLALESLELVEIRYREGEDSLLALLDAQRTAFNVQDQAVQAKSAALRSRASVHRVLADL
ncbi:MAG: TolC family protein [Parvularcula sp.]|jgi:multidrug efflux system outer membrane protein|nr:TolC family protein [Parvularcula sp.]